MRACAQDHVCTCACVNACACVLGYRNTKKVPNITALHGKSKEILCIFSERKKASTFAETRNKTSFLQASHLCSNSSSLVYETFTVFGTCPDLYSSGVRISIKRGVLGEFLHAQIHGCTLKGLLNTV